MKIEKFAKIDHYKKKKKIKIKVGNLFCPQKEAIFVINSQRKLYDLMSHLIALCEGISPLS